MLCYSPQLRELDERTTPKSESKEEEAATRAAIEAQAMGFVQPTMLAITDGYASGVPGYATGVPGYASGMPGMMPSSMGMMPPGMGMGMSVDMYGNPIY